MPIWAFTPYYNALKKKNTIPIELHFGTLLKTLVFFYRDEV